MTTDLVPSLELTLLTWLFIGLAGLIGVLGVLVVIWAITEAVRLLLGVDK